MALPSFRRLLTELGVLTSRPVAFSVWALYAALWLVFDRATLNWNGVATLATWMMTLLIQRAEHRDTQAIHAKLDGLLISQEKAHKELSQVDTMQPEKIEKVRARTQTGAGLSTRHPA
jgi:low affinity Fe/Cu permease